MWNKKKTAYAAFQTMYTCQIDGVIYIASTIQKIIRQNFRATSHLGMVSYGMVWCDLMMTMMKWFRLYSLLIIILYTVRIIKPLTLIVTTSRRRFFIRGALLNLKRNPTHIEHIHISLNTLVISYCACRSVQRECCVKWAKYEETSAREREMEKRN